MSICASCRVFLHADIWPVSKKSSKYFEVEWITDAKSSMFVITKGRWKLEPEMTHENRHSVWQWQENIKVFSDVKLRNLFANTPNLVLVWSEISFSEHYKRWTLLAKPTDSHRQSIRSTPIVSNIQLRNIMQKFLIVLVLFCLVGAEIGEYLCFYFRSISCNYSKCRRMRLSPESK